MPIQSYIKEVVLIILFLITIPAFAEEVQKAQFHEVIINTGDKDSGGQNYVFRVYMAITNEEKTRGLMNRKILAEDRGMLFDYFKERNVAIWMKDTYIPLDILFVRNDGTIAKIVKNATPLSEKIIPSGGAVRAVLEIKGGICDKLGIKVGHKLEHEIFGK